MHRALTRILGVNAALMVCTIHAAHAVVPVTPDAEAPLRGLQATAAMKATWDALVSALLARDKKAASMFIHPNRRVEFLLKSPEDLTRLTRPQPVGERAWNCSNTSPIASCTFRFLNKAGESDEMEIPFVEAAGIWYITF
jgi:hypothetical protein